AGRGRALSARQRARPDLERLRSLDERLGELDRVRERAIREVVEVVRDRGPVEQAIRDVRGETHRGRGRAVGEPGDEAPTEARGVREALAVRVRRSDAAEAASLDADA